MKKIINICHNKYLNYTCILLGVTSIFVVSYSLNSNTFAEFIKIASTLLLLQLFSFLIGSFLGFLFGFPAHNNIQFNEKYQRNSSLKEITSWLTKIIVGVTLIELKDIFIYLQIIVRKISYFIQHDDSHVVIISSILGIYFVLGFIVLYILSVTTIFEELVINDKNIDFLLSEQSMNPNPLNIDNIDNVLKSDFSQIDNASKERVLRYVSKYGLNKLEPLLTKRLGKFLLALKEYDSAAKAYESAYYRNKQDKYSLLNSCFIKSKYLKDFDNSNRILKEFINENPDFAPAHYNLACNYYREYLEFCDTDDNEYVLKLKDKAKEKLKKAFELDKGLYSEALKDSALAGLEINEIFKESKKEEKE
ncbi:hypothetical protein EZL74_11045 [Flavobacterium silvisoli]|uniref:Tetratricopeptide repeat protein n=1 Tax=Flavobacterium silvisoli TaxID=2529433 RepID=A0A4Q9YRG2_9FLAO|nr:hypothetical protein [Flavobacterium silvisoli]TBX66117.1 hypothetical protein EZL74_11045 [Flavobacterium silvisoli]